MKKGCNNCLSLCFVVVLLFSLVVCPVSATSADGILAANSLDELESAIQAQIDGMIQQLQTEWDEFSAQNDTYEKYLENADGVTAFYNKVLAETKNICITIREDCIVYANMIIASSMSNKDKYRAIDGMKDCVYKGVCDDVKDEIYDVLLDDMKDFYYDGILEDAKDSVDYSEWYDVCSGEYSQWYNTSSKVYSEWYDTSSDVYSLYYDLSGDFYGGDMTEAEKRVEKFNGRVQKLIDKANSQGEISADFNTAIEVFSSAQEFEAAIDTQVSGCIQAIKQEWVNLSSEIDSFELYFSKVDEIEAFYEYVVEQTTQVLVMVRGYSVAYADFIVSSQGTNKEKYNNLKDVRDCTYEDACKTVKDEIYDGILQEMKDYFYEGILKNAKDQVKYSEWSDARSDEYGWWSDARSDVYGEWSDARSDIYSFISDVRSEVYSGDLDGAAKKIQRFSDKIERMK